MNDDDRDQLEARLRRLEDESAIRRLVMSYGPAADAGLTAFAANVWLEDGVYDWDADGVPHSGRTAVDEMLQGAGHQGLIAHGVAHFAGPLLVEVEGDQATALNYSLIMRREDDRYFLWRVERGALGRGASGSHVEGPSADQPLARRLGWWSWSVRGHAARPVRGGSTMTGRLDGKVAIITGASTGLGPVMGALFVREGARVLLAARREELVREAADAAGEGAIAMRADVTDEADVAAMVARAVDAFGHVDIMCNNAAAPGIDKWVWEQTLENWNATISIDVTAAMLCTREVLKQSMLERRSGVILNFSSTAAYNGMVRKTHYVTAKASLRAFTKAVALEVGPRGIRCNCVVPGSIDTELWQNWVRRTAEEQDLDYESHRARLISGVALRDISSPRDVAHLALFLASDEARTITGQSIPVDAGGYMQG